MLAQREIIECQCQLWWPSAGCQRRLPDDSPKSARKQSGAVAVRERQTLLGDLDSQHTERRRGACVGSCGQSFHCFRYWRTAAFVTLDGVLVFHIEFAEQSPAYRFIVLALFGFLSCRLYEPCGGIGPAGLAVWQDGETCKVLRRAAVSFARYSATPSALVAAGNSSASIRTLPVNTFIIRRTGMFLEHVIGNVEISSKFMTYPSL
jgi:hypothetical protein